MSYIMKWNCFVKYIALSFTIFSNTTVMIHQFQSLTNVPKHILINEITLSSGDTAIG